MNKQSQEMQLPATRLSQHAVRTASDQIGRIRPLVRVRSDSLTTQCRQHGLSADLAEVCGGLLASVIDDLVEIGRMRRNDYMRTKRKERVLAAASEPAASALRIAMAASPVNGRAAVSHWDVICEKHEIGKFAWLLGAETETAYRYGRKIEKMQNRG